VNGWVIAILPLVGVLIGGGLQYLSNTSLERRKHLSSLRAAAYADYFRAVSSLATAGRSSAAVSALAEAKGRMCLYGSPRVLGRLAQLERHGANLASPDARAAILDIVSEARKDTTSTGASVENADLSLILFGSHPTAARKPLK
jgi:hypothetical protein